MLSIKIKSFCLRRDIYGHTAETHFTFSSTITSLSPHAHVKSVEGHSHSSEERANTSQNGAKHENSQGC